MAKVANPQGKGADLMTIHWLPVIKLQEKSEQHIITDYVKSMLILSAEFNFKPVYSAQYYLYLWGQTLRLSLIPFDKCPDAKVYPIAECQLRTDLTWCVDFIDSATLHERAKAFLVDFSEKFEKHLGADNTLSETLPFYEADLPFYRRLYAAGLAKSLSMSLKQGQLEQKKVGEMVQSVRLLS